MMEVGRNGVLLEIVPIQEAIAKEHGRDIVIHPGHRKEAYPVLDPIQRQSFATKNHALVGDFENPEIFFRVINIHLAEVTFCK